MAVMVNDARAIPIIIGADPVVDRLMDTQRAVEGQRVTSQSGREYRIANVRHQGGEETLQVERLVPKIRGKAARKAEKRRRHAARR